MEIYESSRYNRVEKDDGHYFRELLKSLQSRTKIHITVPYTDDEFKEPVCNRQYYTH